MSNDCVSTPVGQERFTFARVPNAMVTDPGLEASDVRVAALIIPWLGRGITCWVPVSYLAKGAQIGSRAVRKCLARLKSSLWFSCEESKGNKTGRKFIALWRTEAGFMDLVGRLGAELQFLPSAFTEDGIVTLERIGGGTTGPTMYKTTDSSITLTVCQTPSIVASISPFAEGVDSTTTFDRLSSAGDAGDGNFEDDPTDSQDLTGVANRLRTLKSWPSGLAGRNEAIRAVAEHVAAEFFDEKSIRFYVKHVRAVADGVMPIERFLAAMEQTNRMAASVGLENPGAYFNVILTRKRPTDSEAIAEYARQYGVF